MECLIQWVIVNTDKVFFDLPDKKILIVRVLYLTSKYVGEFGVGDHHAMEVV